jgi:hypothetical protein
LLVGFAIAAALAYYVRRARSLVFSRFWHESRQELRHALKAARKRMQVDQSGISSASVREGEHQPELLESNLLLSNVPSESNSQVPGAP